jgi:protein gp37
MGTKIEWAEETWNPVVGCTKVSEGCANCYAETMACRLKGMSRAKRQRGQAPGKLEHYERVITDGHWSGVELVPEALEEPLHWREPRKVFVCSMSDLFHPDVPFEYIDRVLAIIQTARTHTFMFLTKRPDRMEEYFSRLRGEERHAWMEYAYYQLDIHPPRASWWPLPNLVLGATVENQDMADERVPILLSVDANRHFVSLGPLLGPIILQEPWQLVSDHVRRDWLHSPGSRTLDLVIVEGETGHNARPIHPDWVRNIRDQCVRTETNFFFKKWGDSPDPAAFQSTPKVNASTQYPHGGRMLDGREWNQFPEIR